MSRGAAQFAVTRPYPKTNLEPAFSKTHFSPPSASHILLNRERDQIWHGRLARRDCRRFHVRERPQSRVRDCALRCTRGKNPNAGVLVGYDTRYASERFARAAAEVVSMTGMPVWIAEKACPSPALSLWCGSAGRPAGS